MARTLAIDGGNTHISWGIFSDGELIEVGKLANADEWDLPLDAWAAVDAVGVASVNTRTTERLAAFERDWRARGWSGAWCRLGLGTGETPLPVRLAVPHPEQVGVDRLANALAWRHRAETPAIIVDFGTAITFDLVSRRGIYLGGLILPGPELISRSLARGTSLLPEVAIEPTPEVFGRDTRSALRRGVFGLLRGGVEFHLRALREASPEDSVVVATGGGAPVFGPWFDGVEIMAPYLTLDGIQLGLVAALGSPAEGTPTGSSR